MIIAICGKSGAGKTTLRDLLLKHDKSLTKVISHTTRPLRKGEKIGDDYFFIDEKTYYNMKFVTTRQSGNDLYGTTKEALDADTPLFIVDIGGMHQLKKYAEFKVIFLDPNDNVLIPRLLNRGENIEYIHNRLKKDAEFTLKNIKNIKNNLNILHIKDETIKASLQKSLEFIRS